ncbi:MAG TPA: hypothetical protein VK171_00700, partial [Fimbriimonas sp.]|nr:hypothetical protein [Fimbriimonas sp.]
ALTAPQPFAVDLLLVGEEVSEFEGASWSLPLKLAVNDAKTQRQPFIMLARRWSQGDSGEEQLYFWQPNGVAGESLSTSRVGIKSKTNTSGAVSSIPVSFTIPNATPQFSKEGLLQPQLVVTGLNNLLTNRKRSPAPGLANISVYRSRVSIDATIEELESAGVTTDQIVVCDRGYVRSSSPDYISYPDAGAVKHYKIGFDGKKWFANLERVYR